MSAEKCPKCGAGELSLCGVFSCGSVLEDSGVISRHPACRVAELERALATMTADRDSWCEQADKRTKDVQEQAARADRAEAKLDAITHHMDYCRSLLGTTEDEVLAVSIEEMKASLTAANQRSRELTEWRPIDEDTPMDINLQLGWMEEWPEKRWRQEIKLAGHKNDKPPGMSNGWRHGQATHWLPLTPAPTNR